jgi:hypothetical protein
MHASVRFALFVLCFVPEPEPEPVEGLDFYLTWRLCGEYLRFS